MRVEIDLNQLNSIIRADPPDLNNDEYYKKHMLLADGTTPREIFLNPISANELHRFSNYAHIVLEAMRKIVWHIIEAKRLDLLKKFHLENLDLEPLLERGPDNLFNYGRIDAIKTSDLYKINEVNVRRPQMYHDADWLSDLMFKYGKEHGFKVNRERNISKITDSITYQYRSLHKGETPKNILYIYNIADKEDELSFLRSLKQSYEDTNIISLSCKDYASAKRDLKINSSKDLIYNNQKIDQIVIQFLCGGTANFYRKGEISNAKIREAYYNGSLEISSPPSSLLFGSKTLLALLFDQNLRGLVKLSEEEINAIDNLLPQTLTIENFIRLRNQDPSSYVRQDYVIKSSGSVSGNGVNIGVNMDEADFQDLLYEVNKQHSSIVAQRLISPGSTRIISLNEPSEDILGYPTIEPFFINTESGAAITGYSTRAIRKRDFHEVKKFNPADNVKEILFGGVVEVPS